MYRAATRRRVPGISARSVGVPVGGARESSSGRKRGLPETPDLVPRISVDNLRASDVMNV